MHFLSPLIYLFEDDPAQAEHLRLPGIVAIRERFAEPEN